MRRRAARSTLFPYTTLFRSWQGFEHIRQDGIGVVDGEQRVPIGRRADDLLRSDRAGGASFVLDEERSEEHTSELQSQSNLVCRLPLEQKKPLSEYGVP